MTAVKKIESKLESIATPKKNSFHLLSKIKEARYFQTAFSCKSWGKEVARGACCLLSSFPAFFCCIVPSRFDCGDEYEPDDEDAEPLRGDF